MRELVAQAESAWRAQRERIMAVAPEGHRLAVVTPDGKVTTFDSMESAIAAWNAVDGAIMKPLAQQRVPVITGNHLRHPEAIRSHG